MAILKSSDGNFYEVPDDQLDSLAIPKAELKEKLEECCGPPSRGGGGPGGGGPGGGAKSGGLINVHVYSGGGGGGQPVGASAGSDVEAFSHGHFCGHWRNCWRNCC